MRVRVDHDHCEGNARCQLAAPEVFELRADELSYPLLDEVPPELEAKVERAIRACPKQAIAWTS